VTSVAYFITPAWEWGVQLGVTGVFGVYAGLSRHPDFLIVVRISSTISSLFPRVWRTDGGCD
jgi:hypothetical protein